MCGFAGVLQTHNNVINITQSIAMCRCIAYRGPDYAGYMYANSNGSKSVYFVDEEYNTLDNKQVVMQSENGIGKLKKLQPNVFMGHRRLAIIDTSAAANQPFVSLCGKATIVYNGEIYNYLKLKSELQSLGFNFKSFSDTEVVLTAYLAWGQNCVHKFNGMFAFAIYDHVTNRIFAARDRYGIKPFYYYHSDEVFIFGSEEKVVCEYLGRNNISLSADAIAEYFVFQNILDYKSFYANICSLMPGHSLSVECSINNITLNVSKYWDFKFIDPAQAIKCDISYLQNLLTSSVSNNLIADVEIGSYLSGGIDSGLITTIASQHINGMKTFTVGYDNLDVLPEDKQLDERALAEQWSYLNATEHYEMILKANDIRTSIVAIVQSLDTPRVGQCYPNYYVAKLASRFVKVVLAGTGGDEIFAGYPWRYDALVNCDSKNEYVVNLVNLWTRVLSIEQTNNLLSPLSVNLHYDDICSKVNAVLNGFECDKYDLLNNINRALYFDCKTFLPGLLAVEDRISMLHSVEVRVPFLDNELVDYSLKLSPLDKVKISTVGENAVMEGKLLLRTLANKNVPKPLATAKKKGFCAPDNSWFKGVLGKYVIEQLNKPEQAIYDKSFAVSQAEAFCKDDLGSRLMIWSLLYVSVWTEMYAKQLSKAGDHDKTNNI